MPLKLLIPFAAAIGLLWARPALASAVYAWVPEDPSSCCRGVLELSDEAFAAGGVSWTPGFPLDANPVQRFTFEGRFKVSEMQPVAAQAERDVELAVRFASHPETARCCAWDFQIRIEGDGLTGRLRVTTQNDDIILSGTGNGWSIERAGSDAISSGIICGQGSSTPCAGSRGRWVLISGPATLHKTSSHGAESRTVSGSLPLR